MKGLILSCYRAMASGRREFRTEEIDWIAGKIERNSTLGGGIAGKELMPQVVEEARDVADEPQCAALRPLPQP